MAHIYLRDFTLFGYITGMRKGEIQSLRWSDVNSDTITLRPGNSKNGEGRTIPLEGELAELIGKTANLDSYIAPVGQGHAVAECRYALPFQRLGPE